MTDSQVQRLSSAELEDLAFVILSARPGGADLNLYPNLGSEVRTRLRSRIRQLAKYNWPSSMSEDPQLRRGWTLRQCCRLAVALLMLDAHLPPSLVVQLARNNEVGFLLAIADRLSDPTREQASLDDKIAIVLPGEIRDMLGFSGRSELEAGHVRLIPLRDLTHAWSDDLSGPGARLMIDIPTAVAALWRWIAQRRLMNDTARLSLLAEIERSRGEPNYSPTVGLARRRDRSP